MRRLVQIVALFGLVLGGALALSSPASALSAQECSAKYQTAKSAGTLNGMSWNEFRKAECSAEAPAATPAAATTDTGGTGLTMQECSTKYQAAKTGGTLNGMSWNEFRKTECSAAASTADTSTKSSKATPAKTAKTGDESDTGGTGLTMQECSTKYQTAKAAGTLDGMSWNDFRKARCGAGATEAATKSPPTKSPPADTTPAKTAAAGGTGGLTMKECSVKYQAAKANGTLGGLKWNDFRKTACGSSDDDDAPAVDEAQYTQDPVPPTTTAPRGVKFPSGVASKYASESAGKARMHTCLDAYYANKDANTLGTLHWIQKGGGYYSLCNARLKA